MTLAGADAEKFILEDMSNHLSGVSETLSTYDPIHSIQVWRETMRAVEEFINLPQELRAEELCEDLLKFRLDSIDPISLKQILQALSNRFDENVANRFCKVVCQISAIAMGFKITAISMPFVIASGELERLTNVENAVDYFQSRRRQMLAILYALPKHCRGKVRLKQMDALNVFLPVIEHSLIALTNSYRHFFLCKTFDDYSIDISAGRYVGNYFFQTLDSSFLEPERASITEIPSTKSNLELMSSRPEIDSRKIFSAAELHGELMTLEAGYSEFYLANTGSFAVLARFIVECTRYCKDDYYIDLSESQLNKLINLCNLPTDLRRELVDTSADYRNQINSFAPFVAAGTMRLSTVTWLSRFSYRWASVCLNKIKRYQIRTGFIFENQVKEALTKQGFNISEIKRIDRQEFDVIATRDGEIYNVQCKNNLVDLTQMELNPKIAARYNRKLEKYYVSALRKEEDRENLLRLKFGLSTVKHVVLSKFPIATRNPRILTFREITAFGDRFGNRERTRD